MTFAGAAIARSSLAARLDMSVPWLSWKTRYPDYTPGAAASLLPSDDKIDARRASWSQKCEPGCPGSPLARPGGDRIRTGVRSGRRHQHGVDHMDHAVRLVDVRDRHHRGPALGVDDPDLAVLVLDGQLLAFRGLELLAVGQAGGFE